VARETGDRLRPFSPGTAANPVCGLFCAMTPPSKVSTATATGTTTRITKAALPRRMFLSIEFVASTFRRTWTAG
jgi:hypothetical protein